MLELLTNKESHLLRQESEIVNFDTLDFDLRDLSKELVDIMYKYDGLGLAAPQVGVNKRIFVIKDAPRQMIFVNPIIMSLSQDTTILEEGCLSFPGLFLKLRRSSLLTYSAQTVEGRHITATLSGLSARVFLHEYDHLDGKLFIDKASKIKLQRAREKLLKRVKKHG